MIDKNIKLAATPSGRFYLSDATWSAQQEKIFARSWQYIGNEADFPEPDMHYPLHFMEGCLNEPLILSVQQNGEYQLMSNVCTHRGFILLQEKSRAGIIKCRYHGRCFEHDGKFLSMPEFEAAENFPTRMDDLAKASVENWNGLLFASLFPSTTINKWLGGLMERMYFFPFDKLQFRKEYSKDYTIQANWALYCDNYLEGFHIPFVHKSLNKVIDYHHYETVLLDHGVLQIGVAKESDPLFELPADSPEYGKRIAAYYYWFFPNMMLNFYPWGLSMNIIRPQGKDQTTVSFLVFVCDESKYDRGAGSDLNRVEMEDEEVVESVHRGLQSRLYHSGRYSPKMETGVHHFHRLMMAALETNSNDRD